MQLTKINISNILGIEHLEFDAGKFNEISGKNGSGKTSILESLKAALQGGHDATLIRNGATSAEIVLQFDNGMSVVKRITDKKTDLSLYDERGQKLKSPVTELDKMRDLLSINPVAFLTAAKKDRLNALLEVMPLPLPETELMTILGALDSTIRVNFDGQALDVIANCRQKIYDERTFINREKETKEKSILGMKETLVAYDFSPEQLAKELTEAQEKLKSNEQKKSQFVEMINNEEKVKLDTLQKYFNDQKAKIQDETKEQFSDMNQRYGVSYTPLIERISTLQEQLKNIGAAQKQKDTIQQFSTEAADLMKKSDKLSTAIKEIDDLKKNLLSKLPISGLEIVNGEIIRNGVVFDRLNTAQQVEIAVEVAKMRAGELKLICVDGIEKLDSEAFETLKNLSVNSELQLIVSRVNDEELTIHSN